MTIAFQIEIYIPIFEKPNIITCRYLIYSNMLAIDTNIIHDILFRVASSIALTEYISKISTCDDHSSIQIKLNYSNSMTLILGQGKYRTGTSNSDQSPRN